LSEEVALTSVEVDIWRIAIIPSDGETHCGRSSVLMVKRSSFLGGLLRQIRANLTPRSYENWSREGLRLD